MKNQSLVKISALAIVGLFMLAGPLKAAEPAPAGTGMESSTNVTLDFKDADINNVLRILSLKSGVNIVAGPEVQGTVTIRLSDVPWDRALEVVLRTYGYVYERDGNIIRVTTRERVEQEDLSTETFVLNYITADEVQESISEIISERGKVKAFGRTNTIIVTDVASSITKIAQVIKRLDKATPQAYVDARIVRTELGKTENLGIDWQLAGGLTAGPFRPTTFPFPSSNSKHRAAGLGGALQEYFPPVTSTIATATGTTAAVTANPFDARDFPSPTAAVSDGNFKFGRLDFSQMSAVLSLIKNRTNTKIVSNPRIVVLNNQTAKVQVGEQIGIPTFERNETSGSFEVTGFTLRDVGVVMNVTPHINSADEILVDLKPEVSSFVGYQAVSATLSAPRFTITTASTQVLIRDGETIAIGGLLTDSATTSEDKIPFLGDIPGVGKLFRSKRQTAGTGNNKVETLFFVTVSVVDSQGQPQGQFQK